MLKKFAIPTSSSHNTFIYRFNSHAQNYTTVYINASTVFWLRYNQLQYYRSYMTELCLFRWTHHTHLLHFYFYIISFKSTIVATVYRTVVDKTMPMSLTIERHSTTHKKSAILFLFTPSHRETHTNKHAHTSIVVAFSASDNC